MDSITELLAEQVASLTERNAELLAALDLIARHAELVAALERSAAAATHTYQDVKRRLR